MGVVARDHNPGTWKLRQEDSEFSNSLIELQSKTLSQERIGCHLLMFLSMFGYEVFGNLRWDMLLILSEN